MIKLYFGLNNDSLFRISNAFIEFYNEKTIFQDYNFLKWYFLEFSNDVKIPTNIVIEKNDKIVSHYGLLHSKITSQNEVKDIIWGVNAFTLNEYRGAGYNSTIVSEIFKLNLNFGVIGFTTKVKNFYESNGFAIFNSRRFKRYVYIFNSEIITIINKNRRDRFVKLKYELNQHLAIKNKKNIIELTSLNIFHYGLNFNYNNLLTTYRDSNYYKKRFFDAPYINYKSIAFVDEDDLKAVLVYRIEKLFPWEIKIIKIVDLFGDEECCFDLLLYLIDIYNKLDFYYIDFRVFGDLYNNIFTELKFHLLEGDHYNDFPTTSYPVTFRENIDFVGLKLNEIAFGLEKEYFAYFTSADSDRDRLFNIEQIEIKVKGY